jgi:transposase
MNEIQAYVGLDVHKDTISVAVAEAGREGEVRSWGAIPHETTAINRLVKRLHKKLGTFECVYEAGPCGYGLQRHLAGLDVACRIVAPSKVPVQPGRKRNKNDTNDALGLARLHRAGELTYIWIPDAVHEAMQDLVRARRTSSYQVRKARQRISCFLLKHGRRYERKKWGYRHRVWLADLQFEHAAQQFALQSYLNDEEQSAARRAQIDEQIERLIPDWRLGPIVRELTALRGVDTVIATSVAAEVGDFSRFDNPRRLMSYFGLVPGEFSSGTHVRPRGITKTGSSDVRALLFQAAWLYRLTPKVGQWSLIRQKALSQQSKDIAWKAQLRLHSRYRRLTETRQKRSQVAVTAVARELVGFIWAIARNAETVMLSDSA